MAKYRKKPVVVEAVQFEDTNECLHELEEFMSNGGGELRFDYSDKFSLKIIIKTLEGDMTASEGDYIIKGVNGEYYPCKPDIFHKTYEEV